MGGHDAGTQHQFTGLAKYFNAYTITGRRNVSSACMRATWLGSSSVLLLFSSMFKVSPVAPNAI